MATYYVSNTGNNSNNGLSEATPWQTISHVNSRTFVAGDIILFKRGDVWNEQLVPPNSGNSTNRIVFGAYGTGNDPIITGEIVTTGWVNEGGGIYSYTNANLNTDIRTLTINGNYRHMGRFPKDSWLTINSFSGTTSVTSSSLLGTPNYNGGEAVIMKVPWIIDRASITNHTNGTITYTGGSSYQPLINSGFYIQNHPNCLTEFGDWRYDSSNRKIFMFFGSETPSNYVIKVANRVTPVSCVNRTWLRFENIDIRYGQTNGLLLQNCQNCIVSNLKLRYIGRWGINLDITGGFSNNNLIENCLIEDTGTSAVLARSGDGITVTQSIIRRNALDKANIGNGDQHGGSIQLGADIWFCRNFTITRNIIEDSGYNAIWYAGTGSLIENNIIDRACISKEDGAGIYTFGGVEGSTSTPFGTSTIRRNIIRNIQAPNNPDPYNFRQVYGIYLDEQSNGAVIEENTIIECRAGMWFNQPRVFTCINNKVYRTTQSGWSINVTTLSNANFQNNEFYIESGRALSFSTAAGGSFASSGTFDNNRYVRPVGTGNLFFGNSTGYSTLAAWTSASGKDANSTVSPTSSPVSRIYVNETLDSVSTDIGVNRILMTGQPVSSPQNIPSFFSIIVLEGLDENEPVPDPDPPQEGLKVYGIFRLSS